MDKRNQHLKDRLQIALHRIRMLPNLASLAATQRVFIDIEAILDMIEDGHTFEVVSAALTSAGLAGQRLEAISEKRYHRP